MKKRIISVLVIAMVLLGARTPCSLAEDGMFSTLIKRLSKSDKADRDLAFSVMRSVLGDEAGIELLELSIQNYTPGASDMMSMMIGRLLKYATAEQLQEFLQVIKNMDPDARYAYLTDLEQRNGMSLDDEQRVAVDTLCACMPGDASQQLNVLFQADGADCAGMVARILTIVNLANGGYAPLTDGKDGMLASLTVSDSCTRLLQTMSGKTPDALLADINSNPALVAAIKASGASTGLYTPEVSGVRFADLANHWANTYVNMASEKKLFVGYEDGLFHPDNQLTREEMAVAVVRMMGYDVNVATKAQKFADDAKISDWARKYVYCLADHGIFRGYEDGRFGPADDITREEFAVILARCSGESGAECKGLSFADSVKVSVWALDAVKLLVDKKVISGYEDGTFRPGNTLTRAEACTMMCRFCGF